MGLRVLMGSRQTLRDMGTKLGYWVDSKIKLFSVVLGTIYGVIKFKELFSSYNSLKIKPWYFFILITRISYLSKIYMHYSGTYD